MVPPTYHWNKLEKRAGKDPGGLCLDEREKEKLGRGSWMKCVLGLVYLFICHFGGGVGKKRMSQNWEKTDE